MVRINSLVFGVPLLKKYMEENDVALTKEKAAEIIEGSKETAYNILMYMDGAGIVKRVRRGVSFYVLTDAIDEGRLEAVLENSGAPRKHVPLRRIRRSSTPRIIHRKMDEMEEHMASMRTRAESGEFPSALEIIGLSQEEGIPQEEDPIVLLLDESSIEVLPKVDHGIIRIEPFGSVQNMMKGTRLLSRGEARHLRSYLRGFEGCEKVDEYRCLFVTASALKRGEYGNIFYVSHGSNSWDLVKRVKLDGSIFRYQPLSSTESKIWANWKAFDEAISHEPRYSRVEYEKILNAFIDSGNDMVEIMVRKRTPVYVSLRLKEIIADRGLEGEISVSAVGKWLYLEKVIEIKSGLTG